METERETKEKMARGRNALYSSATNALLAIGVLLFIAMAVGLIVSSVLWRNAVNASQIQRIEVTVFADSPTSGNLTDISGNIATIFSGCSTFIICISNILYGYTHILWICDTNQHI